MREIKLTALPEAADDPTVNDCLRGVSPNYAAAELGVSRQAIHQAIDRGTLSALRLLDGRGNLAAILISASSLAAYRRRRLNS